MTSGMSRSRPGVRRVGALVGVSALVALAVPASAGAQPGTVRAAAALNFVSTWSATLPDAGNPVALSSPTVANLDGQPAAVVGDRSGRLYALHLSDGSEVAGWPIVPDGLPIDSPPSVAGSTVYVGTGNAAAGKNTGGAYNAFNANGSRRWRTTVSALPNGAGGSASVVTGLAIGTLQGATSAVSGTLGQQQDELNADNGAVQPGFPWFEADSNFTTPALADLYGNGQNEIIEGGDSTAGLAYNTNYGNGGHLRILSQSGNLGAGSPNGGLLCQYDTNQTVQSSPAVGTFLPGGAVGITFGTGASYAGASQTDQLLAVDSHCGLRWAVTLNGATTSSPAVVDALGSGQQIAEGTSAGTAYLLNGNTGATIWSTNVGSAIIGSITSADFTGTGYQDLLVPTQNGVDVLDGKTGAQVAVLAAFKGFQGSPLVTQDPSGALGVTVAGYNAQNQGYVEHFSLAGSNGSLANEPGAWPEFHHDAQLTGNAGTPKPVIQVACGAPAGPRGYDMVAADGGVFSFGNLPFCGSTGNVALTRPVVGGAVSGDGGGYWLVASDGGIFAFGDARFYGSLGNVRLTAPIVGMAPTPDGNGYWLVAADGGVFTFGDALFHGSAGSYRLRSPIVGMAATPDGGGYVLAATDGGVFAFGDDQFHGSAGGAPLVRPVVGVAIDPATGGYWLAAADGGVFAYGAPFYGSAGAAPLVKPVVGITDASAGGGYRLVASDGGLFNYGNAPFDGSLGNIHLVQPIVAVSGLPR